MLEEYKSTYHLLDNNVLLRLDLPEDKNFMQNVKSFQNELKALEQKLGISNKLIKNIYFISSELYQAVIHNGVFKKEVFVNNVKISFADKKFYLLSQNLVEIKHIPRIQLKFDEVNSAFDAEDTHAELQLRYDHKLNTDPKSKGMVSVGVLDLARRSLNRILYDFDKLDLNYAVFSIICTVDAD
ncbi:MAG: hypothetical protein HC831_07155 [Chloroflexia bacterium]|nr:hypothetical protein [Chloroflexia bacterium]